MSTSDTTASSRNSFALTTGVVLVCFLVFAGIVGLAYLKNRDTTLVADLTKVDPADQWKYTVDGRATRLAEIRGKEQTVSTTYGWVDQSAGVVRLPIDRAMELVVAEQGRKN
jgi:hypothetical protein